MYTRLVGILDLYAGLNIVIVSIAVNKAVLQTHELLSWLTT